MAGARRAGFALLAGAALLGETTAHASDVRIFVLAPSPPRSLESVETHGADKPRYSHSYKIPYTTIEPQIRNAIKSKADRELADKEPCPTDLCPDVHWRVKVTSSFNFTQQGQPVIKAFGNPQENGVDVSLATQVHLRFDINASLEIKPVTGSVKNGASVSIDLLIGLNAASKLNLWPVVISQIVPCAEVTKDPVTACVRLTLDGKNYDLSDINGAAIQLGAELGAIIGASPIGALIGGDLGSGLLIGALGGNAAANAAKAKIQSEADKALYAALQTASQMATQLGSQYVDAKAMQANALKDFVMKTKLPGINKSYEDLSNAFGVSFDVQTTTSSGDVNVLVTPRFAAAGAGGKIAGKLRMPKDGCTYASGPWGSLPLGFTSVNQDLAAKVGTSCASLLSSTNIKPSGYLGADPKSAKLGGNPLQTWKPVGTATFTGNLSVYSHDEAPPTQKGGLLPHTPTGYYECGFEIANVPQADIIEIALSGDARQRLWGSYDPTPRYVEVTSGVQAILDHDWKLVTGGLVIGGDGQCESAHVKVPHYKQASWLDRMKDLFDPDKCVNCDIQLIDGKLMITNSDPVLEDPVIGSLISALVRGEPLPELPVVAMPGVQVAPQRQAPVMQPQGQQPGVYYAPAPSPAIQQQAPVMRPQGQQPWGHAPVQDPATQQHGTVLQPQVQQPAVQAPGHAPAIQQHAPLLRPQVRQPATQAPAQDPTAQRRAPLQRQPLQQQKQTDIVK